MMTMQAIPPASDRSTGKSRILQDLARYSIFKCSGISISAFVYRGLKNYLSNETNFSKIEAWTLF